jgi:hypothetical protein
MEVVSGVERNNPEADDERPNGKDPFANGAIVMGEGRGLANAENLPAEADGHENDTDREGEPSQGHGTPFYPIQGRCGKRKVRLTGSCD